MRHIIAILFGLAISGTGVYVLYMQLFHSLEIRGLWLIGGGFLAFFGGYAVIQRLRLMRELGAQDGN